MYDKDPVCYRCHVPMSYTFEEAMVAYPEDAPHTIWAASVFECPRCKVRVVSGFAMEPLVRNAKPDELASYLDEYPCPLFLLKG